MKRIATVTCAAVAGLLATAPVAAAGPPQVSYVVCTIQGGTFTSVAGVKSCSTPGLIYPTQQGPIQVEGASSQPAGYFIGHYNRVITNQDIITRTQKGNGPVTTTTTTQQLRVEIVPVDCYLDDPQSGPLEVDTSFCTFLYPTS